MPLLQKTEESGKGQSYKLRYRYTAPGKVGVQAVREGVKFQKPGEQSGKQDNVVESPGMIFGVGTVQTHPVTESHQSKRPVLPVVGRIVRQAEITPVKIPGT